METMEWSLKENSRRLKVEDQENTRLKNSEKRAKMKEVARQKYIPSARVGEKDQGRKVANGSCEAVHTPTIHGSNEAVKTSIVQGANEAEKTPIIQSSSEAKTIPRIQGSIKAEEIPRMQGSSETEKVPSIQGSSKAGKTPRIEGFSESEKTPRMQGFSETENTLKTQVQSQVHEFTHDQDAKHLVKSEDQSPKQKSIEIKWVPPNITRKKEGNYSRWAHVNNRSATKKISTKIVESNQDDLMVIELNPQPHANDKMIETSHNQQKAEEEIQCLPTPHITTTTTTTSTTTTPTVHDFELYASEIKTEKRKEESSNEKLKSVGKQLKQKELKNNLGSREKRLECEVEMSEGEHLKVQRLEVQSTRTPNQSSYNKPSRNSKQHTSKQVYSPKHAYSEEDGYTPKRHKDVMESYRRIKTKPTFTENVSFANQQDHHATPIYRQSHHRTPKQIRAETFGTLVPVSWVDHANNDEPITHYGNKMGVNQPKSHQDTSPRTHHVAGPIHTRSSPPARSYVTVSEEWKEQTSPKPGYNPTGSVERKTIISKGKVVLSSNSVQKNEKLDRARKKKFSYFLNSMVGPAFSHKIPAKLMTGRDFTTGKILPGLHRTDENPCRDQLASFVDAFDEQSTMDPRFLIIAKNNLASCVSTNRDYFYSPGSKFLKKPPIMTPSIEAQQVSNGHACDDD